MDSFDDLLRPGRSVLDDNPFADPFSDRPNSPDPWAPAFPSSLTNHSPSPLPSPRSQLSAAPTPVTVSPSPSSASRPSDEFVSTLDHTAPINDPDHSIAGLSLPEDSEDGGWQTDQKPWFGNLNDDSDDDKPIGQTLKLPEHKSVSVWVDAKGIRLTNYSIQVLCSSACPG